MLVCSRVVLLWFREMTHHINRPVFMGFHFMCGTCECVYVERGGSGVEIRTLDYENPGSNPVLRC